MLKWNISAKVTSLLLFICFVISATLGWIGYRAGKASLEANTLAHQTSINASKASQLSDHLLTIEHQIRTLSQDKTITEAMLNFGAAFEQLNAGAQQGPAGTSRDQQMYPQSWPTSTEKTFSCSIGAVHHLVEITWRFCPPAPVGATFNIITWL